MQLLPTKERPMTARMIGSALCLLLLAGAANAAAPAQTLGVKLQDSSTDPSIAHRPRP